MNAFTAGLDSIKEVLADGISATRQTQQGDGASRHDGFQAAAQDVLTKMDHLIAELRQQRAAESNSLQTQQGEKTARDSHTLVSVLEEQFRAMETWLLPMTHGDKAEKDRVIDQLAERFTTMVQGYNRLIGVLQSRKAERDATAATPDSQPKKTPRKGKP